MHSHHVTIYVTIYVTTVQHQSHEPPCFLSCHHEPRGGFLACGNSKININQAKDRNQLKTSCFKRTRSWRNMDKKCRLSWPKIAFLMAKSWWNWGTGSTTRARCGALPRLPSAGAMAATMYRQQRTIDTCRVLKSPSAASLKDHHSALGWTWRVVLRQPSGRTPNVWVSSVWQTQTGEDGTGTIREPSPIGIGLWEKLNWCFSWTWHLDEWEILGNYMPYSGYLQFMNALFDHIWSAWLPIPEEKKGQLGFEHVRAHPIYNFVLFFVDYPPSYPRLTELQYFADLTWLVILGLFLTYLHSYLNAKYILDLSIYYPSSHPYIHLSILVHLFISLYTRITNWSMVGISY